MSALFEVVVGLGIFGFLLRIWEAYIERQRELKGLLRLLYDDIFRNRKQLESYAEHPYWITSAPAHTLRSRNWQDNKVRVAQLLGDVEFGDIAKYFENLIEIDEYRRGTTTAETTEQDRQRAVPKNLPLLEQQQYAAVKAIVRHISVPAQEVELLKPGDDSDEEQG